MSEGAAAVCQGTARPMRALGALAAAYDNEAARFSSVGSVGVVCCYMASKIAKDGMGWMRLTSELRASVQIDPGPQPATPNE